MDIVERGVKPPRVGRNKLEKTTYNIAVLPYKKKKKYKGIFSNRMTLWHHRVENVKTLRNLTDRASDDQQLLSNMLSLGLNEKHG